MEYLLLLSALLLCAAVLSLRVSEPLEAEGESPNPGFADRVVLSNANSADEQVGYAARVYESIQTRRLGSVLKSRLEPSESACGSMVIRRRVTYYRIDGSIDSTRDTEVVQLVGNRSLTIAAR
jgi:hypothetical protein